jgi:YegS/Rv2252/BmrU family lipid kinase
MSEIRIPKQRFIWSRHLARRASQRRRSRHQPNCPPRRVAVIINPGAGQESPNLKTLNTAFQAAGIEWGVDITQKAGDAERLAREAVQGGVDLVACFGGDGTVMEVTSGLIGTGTPLAILPGGTGNILAAELGIPRDLRLALNLICGSPSRRRAVDVGHVLTPGAGRFNFLLRAGAGFEADVIGGADRELKDMFGPLAYAIATLEALVEPAVVRYQITVDGQVIETEGITCTVANIGSVGLSPITLAPGIDASDGWLDVVVVRRADLTALVDLAASVVGGLKRPLALERWRGRKVQIIADPPQSVQVDGDVVGQSPLAVELLPQAIEILAP